MADEYVEGARIRLELLELGSATVGESGALAMAPRLRPVWSGARLCSRAFTVACAPGDNLAIHVAVTRAPVESVLVVSVGDDPAYGYWGEVLTTAAEARRLSGLVIDGGVRDTTALETHAFPVFASTVALRGASKDRGGEVGTPVVVGGVPVRSFDLILADSDGVVVIDQSRIAEVLQRATARAEKERDLFAELKRGRTTVELLGLDDSKVAVANLDTENLDTETQS